MLHLSASCRYYLYNSVTDMRKGFDSLCGIVTQHMNQPTTGGSIFIFFNKKRNQVKLLLWEGDGFALYYKRLEKGTYKLPAYEQATACITLTHQQLQLILQGISLQQVRQRKRYQHLPAM